MKLFIKLLIKFSLSFCFLFMVACSQHKNNYVVTKPFVMPKGESKFAKFTDLYPTEQISDVDAKVIAQESEQYLNPPTVG